MTELDVYQVVDAAEAIFVGPQGYCSIDRINVWERFGRVCFTFRDARNNKEDFPFLNFAVSISLDEFNSLIKKLSNQ